MNLQFYGAAGEVTGSNTLLESKGSRILVDCGVFQGEKMIDERNCEPFAYDAAKIDAVILTHAHLDHCGRLPKLVAAGFRGPIYATPPTRDLALLSLEDSADLIAEEAEEHGHEPFFTKTDVDNLAHLFRPVEYGQTVMINSDLNCRFQEAGHILGSASVIISDNDQRVIFSGDLGNHTTPLLPPPAHCDQADSVVLETTYGHRVHESAATRRQALQSAIESVVKSRGVLMIPAFAIQRVQEILFELNYLAEHQLIPTIPYFVDSPLAIRATDIFRRYTPYFSQSVQRSIRDGDNIFQFPGLAFTLSVDESKRINDIAPPKVIIAGSGMLTGGRIRHHLRRYISDPKSYLLLVGYQVPGTLGRQLLDGRQQIKIFGETHAVRAQVNAVTSFSAHADQQQLLTWFNAIQGVQTVYLNHGEAEQTQSMAASIKKQSSARIIIPAYGQHY